MQCVCVHVAGEDVEMGWRLPAAAVERGGVDPGDQPQPHLSIPVEFLGSGSRFVITCLPECCSVAFSLHSLAWGTSGTSTCSGTLWSSRYKSSSCTRFFVPFSERTPGSPSWSWQMGPGLLVPQPDVRHRGCSMGRPGAPHWALASAVREQAAHDSGADVDVFVRERPGVWWQVWRAPWP